MSATTMSDVRKRKHLLRHRARLAELWGQLFPQHDFGTGQLRFEQDVLADPGWTESAREYHEDRAGRPAVVEIEPQQLARLRKLMAHNVSLDRLWHELNDPLSRPTPQVTIEAILSCVRERGIATLNEPKNIGHLRGCDVTALAEINQRIAKLKVIESHG
jgi:hypothetical protein